MWDRLIENFVNRLPTQVIQSQGEKYIAGHSIPKGIAFMEEVWERGIMTTADILGESARSVSEASHYFEAYIKIIELLKESAEGYSTHKHPRRPLSISVKPSSICHVLSESPLKFNPETPLYQRLENLVGRAEELDILVTVDMEDHNYTDETLNTAERIWAAGHRNFGIVLQSRLHRTRDDIEQIFSKEEIVPNKFKRVRACIGIYKEPAGIAVTTKIEAKRRLRKDVCELLLRGIYTEVATHDLRVVEDLSELVTVLKIDPDFIEFQMLKGPRVNERNISYLKERGIPVRVYAPIEINSGDGLLYQRRRLKNNPELFLAAVRDKFRV